METLQSYIPDFLSVDHEVIVDFANHVTKLKMYPFFEIAHYALMCMAVKEDATQAGVQFSRKHPLACWVSSMMLCFSGGIIANLLLGDPALAPFKNHQGVLLATAVWYVIFYSPFDFTYKLAKFYPFKLGLCLLKEVLRARKVHDGVLHVLKHFPNGYLLMIIIGTIKGAGYLYIRPLERLVRGVWQPSNNELLSPSFVTKACVIASIVYIMEYKGILIVPHAIIHLGVTIFFLYMKISSMVFKIGDPFVPFENLFSALVFGGMWDALQRAMSREESSADGRLKNDSSKSKEEKKKD